MKKFSLLFITMLMSGLMAMSYAQVDVTFQVDMANEDVSADGVHVAGSFQGWDPSATELTQVGATSVYEVTLQIEEGYYEYKFVNGNAWGSDENVPPECNQNGNRFINVGTDPMVLDVVCFGSCDVCTVEVNVTFQVNMANEDVSADGVHIAGNFQGWDPGATEMTLDYDAVYSYTALIAEGTYLEYKFVNGNAWGSDENVPACCQQNGNRYLTVPDEDVVIDLVCFGSCFDCGPAPGQVEVTFQVDMNNETVSEDGVHIVGSFQGWDPGNTPMIDAGNGIYYYTATLDINDCIEYKYVNGDEWGEDESVPGECAAGFNRFLTVPGVDEILDPVCYGACGPCVGGTEDLFISEYAEGSSNNKYVEIFNGTGAPVDLSGYNTHRISNGGDWDENVYPLSGILEDGDVYVIANSNADPYILDRADETSALTFYNGDDAVGLSKNDGESWTIIDGIGEDGPDPGSGWDVAGVPNATSEHTLIRKPDVCAPNADWASSAGTDAANSEWIVEGQDYWNNLGFHNAVCGGTPVTEMPAFSHPAGTYFSAFNLEITCATPNAVIYYTTDGSEPDNTATEYTAPINLSTNTTVKARAYAPGYQQSFVTEAIYEFEDVTQVANIAELRAMYSKDETYYQITGEVILTFQQDFRNQKYIQDASAAVLIDDDPGIITTSYDIGDGITGMIGSLTSYGNMLQFNPAVDPGPPSSTGNEIIPEVITLDEMVNNFEEYEAELVKIEGVAFENLGFMFDVGTEYPISDGNKANATFRTTFYDVDYIEELLPQQSCDVTGLCNSRWEGDFITSRSMEDFSIALPEADITITEIMYNPPNNDDYYEFVEFYNSGDAFVNLLDWEITEGVSLTFPDHMLAPGEYVVASADPEEFNALFGVDSYQFSGGLSNGGEDVELSDPFGNAYAYVDYDDGGDWYPVTDGEGPSLTFCDPELDNNDPANWAASTLLAGINEEEGFYCTPMAGCNFDPALPVWYEEGWNGISSNLLMLEKMMMDELFAQAQKNTIIVIGKNGIFWPGENINTIGEWDTYQGYKAKFDGDTYFVYPGVDPEDRTVTLDPGIHFIPVLSEGPVAVEDVIVPHGNAIEFMFDIHYGEIYWPAGGIVPGVNGALENLFPGYAYLTKVNSEVTLDFTILPPKDAQRPVAQINNTTWNDVVATGEQHIISIAETALQQLEAGDVAGVFNAQGTCVGMVEFAGDETALPLAVYGDDMTTGEIDGMTDMETMNIRIYRNGEEISAEATYNTNLQHHNGTYAENGLSMITGLKLGATGIDENEAAYSIYPNPANGMINIDITGTYTVEITNAQGQIVQKVDIDGNSTVNLTGQPEGVYFIKLTNETSSLIEKVILR